jgi:hypothetical protein
MVVLDDVVRQDKDSRNKRYLPASVLKLNCFFLECVFFMQFI